MMMMMTVICVAYITNLFLQITHLPRYLRDASEMGVFAKFRYSKALQPIAIFFTTSSQKVKDTFNQTVRPQTLRQIHYLADKSCFEFVHPPDNYHNLNGRTQYSPLLQSTPINSSLEDSYTALKKDNKTIKLESNISRMLGTTFECCIQFSLFGTQNVNLTEYIQLFRYRAQIRIVDFAIRSVFLS